MNKDVQEIKDFQLEYQEKWCEKVRAFMEKNFPVGSKINRDGKEYEVIDYLVDCRRPEYLVCAEIIREERCIGLYELFDMVEKKGGEK